MVNVKAKICVHLGCNKQSSFGYYGKKREYCSKHKVSGMVNLRCKKCKYPKCNKSPSFCHYTQTTATYCKTHTSPDMINIKALKHTFN